MLCKELLNGLRYPRWVGGGTPSDWKNAEVQKTA